MGGVRHLAGSAGRLLALNTDFYLRRRTPTIVYSMERTGSVAMYQSLAAYGEFAIATHYLDLSQGAAGRLSGSARWASRHIVGRRKPARIISLVRNPVENMLSVFARGRFAAGGTGGAGDFAAEYLEKERYRHMLTWFEAEFEKALGVDVYARPFDKEEGLVRFREGPFEVLIVRTELDDERKARAVGEVLGTPGFAMVRGAAMGKGGIDPGLPGERAAYGESYRALKRGVVIPERHWQAIAGSRFARHFFTERELAESRERSAG